MTLLDSSYPTEFYKHATLIDGMIPSQQDWTQEIPRAIGPYHIQAQLTRGGMSLIYLGLHKETAQQATIKVLLPKYAKHPNALTRFQKEAKLLQLIQSPYLVKIYAEGHFNDTLYIAMEHIIGISLREFILKKRYTLKKTLSLILEIAQALSEVHAHGIIHRDLKPENILLTATGHVKLLDLGIAKQPQENNEVEQAKTTRLAHQVMGTPIYMSPEQKLNSQAVTPASDIYALGVISYELILGQPSYGDFHLPLLPPGLQRIVRKSMHVQVQERYSSVKEFQHALESYLQSPQLQKDTAKQTSNIELYEKIEVDHLASLPQHLPQIANIEIGLMQQQGLSHPQVYYDFFVLDVHNTLIIIAETVHFTAVTPLHLAQLRSVIACLLSTQAKNLLDPLAYITQINNWLVQDPCSQQFTVSFAILDQNNQQFTYLSCGQTQAWLLYKPDEVAVHALCSNNAALGSAKEELFSFVIPWSEGNTLLLASTAFTQLQERHELLQAILEETNLSSAQLQAQSLWLGLYPFTPQLIQQQQSAVLIALKYQVN